MKTIKSFSVILPLLLIALLVSCGNIPGDGTIQGNMIISQIGSDYLDLEDTYDYGTVFTDLNGNIFVYSSTKGQILRYTEASGFIEVYEQNASALLTSSNSAYFAKEVWPDHQIYRIESNLSKTLVETIQFSSWIDQFGTIDFGINSGYVVYAERESTQIIHVEIFNRTTKNNSIVSLDVGESIYNVYGLALSDKSAFVISWQSSGRKLHIVDLATETLNQTVAISIGNPDYIQYQNSTLYAGDSNNFTKYDIDINDNITTTTEYAAIDNFFEIYHSSYYQDSFYSIGRENGQEVLMKYTVSSEANSTIYTPQIPDDALFDTWAIAVDENITYIGCGSNIKVFIDGAYQSLIPLVTVDNDYRPANIAINGSGLIGTTHNDTYMGYIDNSNLFQITDSSGYNLYGISVLGNDNFVLRQRGGGADVITEYNTAAGTFSDLFTLADEYITADNVTVLPGDILVLNWDDQLKKYSKSGALLSEGPLYQFEQDWNSIRDFVYSSYWDKIILLASDCSIYFINPDTLEIETVYDPLGVTGVNNIDVNTSGEIFIGTYDNEVHKIIITDF